MRNVFSVLGLVNDENCQSFPANEVGVHNVQKGYLGQARLGCGGRETFRKMEKGYGEKDRFLLADSISVKKRDKA